MSLRAIDVFENTVYGAGQDLLKENVAVFNANSNGAIVLSEKEIVGDFAQSMNIKLGNDLIKSRNPYVQTALTDKGFQRERENIVKLGFGTNPIFWTNAEFNWVKQNPALAGTMIAKQVAEQTMQKMAEFAIGSVATVLNTNNDVKYTIPNTRKVSHNDFVQALRPMGDQLGTIGLYVIHSSQYYDLLETTFKNAERLWDFGNFSVMRTALGQNFLITDNKGLVGNNEHYMLGLKPNSVLVGTNKDFDHGTEKVLGQENIAWRYQSEWTSALQIANYRYKTSDTMNGLTYAQVTTSANWERISNRVKDETGVILVQKS